MSQQQMMETTVGGRGWQRTFTTPIIKPKPKPTYRTYYNIVYVRKTRETPIQTQAPGALTRSPSYSISPELLQIPEYQPEPTVLTHSPLYYISPELQKPYVKEPQLVSPFFGAEKGKALAYIARYQPEFFEALPKGYQISRLTSTPEGYEVEYTVPSQVEQKVPTQEQIMQGLQKQLPGGAKITWFAETKKGEYSVSYDMPKEKEVGSKLIRADISGPFRDFISYFLSAPTAADIEAMRTSPLGIAIPITDIEVFGAALTFASIVAPKLQEKFWATPQQSYYQAMSKMSKQLYRETALEKVGFKQSTSVETWLNIQQPLETARFQPSEQWYRVTRGTPQTPFSKTLENAIYGSAKGGLSAEQILVPKSTWKIPPALLELTMQPKIIPTTRTFPIFGFWLGQKQTIRQATLTISKPKAEQRTLLKQPVRLFEKQSVGLRQQSLVMPRLTQTLRASTRTQTSLIQMQKTVQIQMASQMQGFRQTTSGKTLTQQTRIFPTRFKMPETPWKTRGSDLFGRWYRRGHKIRSPMEAASVFGFRIRKRKGGGVSL